MNAPDRKVLTLETQAFLDRKQPARYGWGSDRPLMIVKGEEIIELSPDDVRALAKFMAGCSVGPQPL